MDAQEIRIFALVLLLLVVLGGIFYYFIISLKRHHRKILELKQRNMTAELDSIEQDRARIAFDLHDELSPVLSAIKLKVSSFDLPDEEDRVQQKKTDEHLGAVLSRLRTISFDLMPATLKRKGLVAAVQEFLNYASDRNRLEIQATIENVSLNEMQSVHLYRLVQEIVQNAVKHSGASLLQIELREIDNKIILSTKDNGKGFEPEKKLEDGEGFGLRNIHSRTDVLGGDLSITSKAGKGTVHTIKIPTN